MMNLAAQLSMSGTPIFNKRNIVFVALAIGTGLGIAVLSGGGVATGGGFKVSGDLLNLLTVVGGVIGVWQLAGNALDSMRSESDKRDRYHDREIADLKTRLEAIATSLTEHQQAIGHTKSLEQILQLKDQVSDIRAALAVSTRQGEIFLKLDRLEKELELLKVR